MFIHNKSITSRKIRTVYCEMWLFDEEKHFVVCILCLQHASWRLAFRCCLLLTLGLGRGILMKQTSAYSRATVAYLPVRSSSLFHLYSVLENSAFSEKYRAVRESQILSICSKTYKQHPGLKGPPLLQVRRIGIGTRFRPLLFLA